MIVQFQARQLCQRSAKPKTLAAVGLGLGKCPHDVFVAKAMVAPQLPNGLCEILRHRLLARNDVAEEGRWQPPRNHTIGNGIGRRGVHDTI